MDKSFLTKVRTDNKYSLICTIPVSARKYYGLKAGDIIQVQIMENKGEEAMEIDN